MTVSDPITNPETEMLDDLANATDTVHQKLIDALSPGYQPEFAPDEAERVGAFSEDALSEQDALDSSVDLPDAARPTHGGEDAGARK
jgi:hypothetical protein